MVSIIKTIKRLLGDRGYYCIAYRPLKLTGDRDRLIDTPGESFTVIKPSYKYWYADPMLIDIGDSTFIFAEQYDRSLNKGNIAVAQIDDNGRVGGWTTIIDEKTHFSFPNVFYYKDNLYMIPESSQDGTIRIYRMNGSVLNWELEKKLDLKKCVDTAVYINEGKIFLLTCEEKEDDPLMTRLRCFRMDLFPDGDPEEIDLGEPSKNYSYVLRNGGNIICNGPDIYRVIQYSTETYYGKSFAISMIESFNQGGLNENIIQVSNIEDFNYFHKPLLYKMTGTHSYTRSRKYEAIDICGTYVSLKNLYLRI